MKKNYVYIAGAIAVIIIGIILLQNSDATPSEDTVVGGTGYQNIAYTIDGQEIQLVNGKAETAAATGSAQVITQVAGYEAEGDLNEDGKTDVALLLTQDTGGSGTFYYIVAALQTDSGFEGTTAGFVGDRITPDSVVVESGFITVHYDRPAPGAPVTSEEVQRVSKEFVVVNGELVSASSL